MSDDQAILLVGEAGHRLGVNDTSSQESGVDNVGSTLQTRPEHGYLAWTTDIFRIHPSESSSVTVGNQQKDITRRAYAVIIGGTMCGRTACTLAPDEIQKACAHKNKKGKKSIPKWRDPPGGQKYYTSYNMAPGSHTPVLIQQKRSKVESDIPEETTVEGISDDSDWVLQPMHWGLIPSWHKGDPKSVGFNMSNARSDGMLEKATFKKPLEKGQRCVILCEGYYEWNTGKDGSKQPYYIYFPKPSDDGGDSDGISCKQLVTMAGLYEVWKPSDGGAPIYSYSIITVDAHKKISWLHHRMPAVLNGEKEVRDWLDSGSVPLSKAVELVRSKDCVTYHPVSTQVNSSKNKSPDCITPIDLEKQKKKEQASSNFMKAWLTQKKRKSEDSTESSKKAKS